MLRLLWYIASSLYYTWGRVSPVLCNCLVHTNETRPLVQTVVLCWIKISDINLKLDVLKGWLKLLPVIMTRAVRQEKEETSNFMRWRVWENSKMESIQFPKPRTHCDLWSTAPLQKMSLSISGLELQKEKRIFVDFMHISSILNMIKLICYIVNLLLLPNSIAKVW